MNSPQIDEAMPHPFDALHVLVHEAYQRDDAVRYKLDAWLRKNDPRPQSEWPKVTQKAKPPEPM